MKQSITIILLTVVLLGGIAGAEDWKFAVTEEWKYKAYLNSAHVWIGSSFAATLIDGAFVAVNTFSLGEEINLPLVFFIPYSDNWEINWIITESAGTVVFLDYETEFIAGQSIEAKYISTALPVGDYTFTSAVIGRGVGMSAVSHQYRFIVR